MPTQPEMTLIVSDVLVPFIPDENSEPLKIPGFPIAQITLLDR
jgi:hypothetical protein